MCFTVEDDLREVSFTCADSLAWRMTSEAMALPRLREIWGEAASAGG